MKQNSGEKSQGSGSMGSLLRNTRWLARVAGVMALPLLVLFTLQDLFVVQVQAFLPARVLAFCLFALSLWVACSPKAPLRLVATLHGLALAGSIWMSAIMFLQACILYPDVTQHAMSTSLLLSIMQFVVLVFAGDMLAWLPLIIAPQLLAIIITLGITGQVSSAWVNLSNPVFAFVVVFAGSRIILFSRAREQELLEIAQTRLRQMEAIIDAVTESAFLMDLDGTVLYCNNVLARRMKTERRDLLGKNIYTFLDPQVAQARREQVERVIASGKEVQFEDKRGEVWIDQMIQPVRDNNGTIRYLAVFGKDISLQKQREEQLVYQILHDSLTGVGNRRNLSQRLRQAISRAGRGYQSCLLYLDLDHFKEINDQFGHLQGDKVLVAVANILTKEARDHDAVFRLGGDEFAVLLEGTSPGDAMNVAERLRASVEHTCREDHPDCKAHVTMSIGMAVVDGQHTTHQLLEQADGAMYKAKQGGRNKVQAAD